MTDQPLPPEGTLPDAGDVAADVPSAETFVPAAEAPIIAAPVEVPVEVPAPLPAPAAAAFAAAPPPAAPPPAAGWSTYTPAAAPQPAAGWSTHTPAGPAGPAPGWEYGGFWLRAVAWIIDGFILGIITTVFWVVVVAVAAAIGIGAVGSIATDGTLSSEQVAVLGVGLVAAVMFLGLMTLIVTVLYFVLLWVKRGATLGQSVLGLRVARESDGGPIGWGTAIIRYIMLMIGCWIFYLGVIWVAFEPRKRGWHDIVAGTLVVKRS